MHTYKLLGLFLIILFCSSCGSSQTNSDEVTQSVTYKDSTPGNSAPDMTYTESITISRGTMTVVRTGGTRVVSGTWQVDLKSSEVATINGMEVKANQPEVTDKVSTNIIYDVPSLSLQIGNKIFQSGMVDDQLHELPNEAETLVAYLEKLLVMYCGNRYSN